MKTALIVLMLAAFSLAGCFGDDGATDPDTTGEPTPTEGTGNQTAGNETGQQNGTSSGINTVAPTVTFSSDLGQGNAPLAVSFAFNATDADGNNLTWTFSSGIEGADNVVGDLLPATVNVTYEVDGSYVALVSVFDGNHTTEANITIIVQEGAQEVPGPMTFSSTTVSTGPLGCAFGTDGLYHYYNKAISGVWLYSVSGSPLVGATTTEWWDDATSKGTEGASGIIPSSTDNVAVCSDTPGDLLEYTLTLQHPDYLG